MRRLKKKEKKERVQAIILGVMPRFSEIYQGKKKKDEKTGKENVN